MGKATVYNLRDFFKRIPGAGALIADPLAELDCKTVNDVSLVVIPTGVIKYAQTLIMRLTTISGSGGTPKLSFGTNSPNFDNIVGSTTLTGLNTVDDIFVISLAGTLKALKAGDDLHVKVTNVATFTTYKVAVAALGVTIPE